MTAHERKDVVLGDNDAEVLTDPAEIRALLRKVAWPSHEPIQFLRRRGTVSPGDEERYVRFHTVESMESMYRLGIRLPKRFHLFKGFGIEHERKEIEKTIECARWLHAHGMKISVYVGGTMFSDSFFQEVPEAVNWLRRDQAGDPITYSGFQLWRYFPCLNNPDYLEYVNKVLDIAVDEIEADEIFFDNQILRHEPRSCRCEHCVRHLREYVARTYSPEELERRYGFREAPLVNPPVWSQACKPWIIEELRAPCIQDWVAHRTHTLVEFYRTMADHVHAKSPRTVVGLNIKGVHAHNRAFNHGVDHNLLASEGRLQFSCLDAGQAHPRMTGQARISEVRTFKSANSLKLHFTCGDLTDLGLAEYQVFTYRPFLEGYGWMGSMDMAGRFSAVAQFFRLNQRLFRGRRHIYEVGVVRASATMNNSNRAAHEAVYPVEETLLSAKLPVGLVFDMNRDELDGYKVLVLAEQRGLGDEWIDALVSFAERGGGVVFAGNTGDYDGWYRPRTGGEPSHGLEPFFGGVPKKSAKKRLGKGRVVYLPELALPFRMDRTDWPYLPLDKILPLRDGKPLLDAVNYAAGSLIAAAKGPRSVLMEVIEGEEPESLSLHFVNYDAEKKGDLSVEVRLPEGKKEARAELLAPAKDKARSLKPPAAKKLPVKVAKGIARFSLPVPPVYSAVIVRW